VKGTFFMAKVLTVDAACPDPTAIAEAAAVLKQGGLIIVPTETVYGLAADPTVPGASDRLYNAKGRDFNKPVAFLASSTDQVLASGANFGRAGLALAKRYWPGSLTLVLQVQDGTFSGFRVPAHQVPVAVSTHFTGTLMLTSANRSGEADPQSCFEAVAAIGDHVGVALDSGPCEGGVPSTVVKVDGDSLTLLREGAVPFSEVKALHDATLAEP